MATGRCARAAPGGTRSALPSSITSATAWPTYVSCCCPTGRRSRRGPTSSSATGAANGTRWTRWCSVRGGCTLIELKHYRGTITGNAYWWRRGRRGEISPLLAARRKAQRLKSVITDALAELQPDLGSEHIPFVQECVFLHAPDGQAPCHLATRPTCSDWRAPRRTAACRASPGGCWSRPRRPAGLD